LGLGIRGGGGTRVTWGREKEGTPRGGRGGPQGGVQNQESALEKRE